MYRSISFVLLMLFLAACGPEPSSNMSVPDVAIVDTENQAPPNALVSGSFARSENVFERGTYNFGFNNSSYGRINFATPTEAGRAVMVIFEFESGGLNHPDLQIGSSFSVDRNNYTEGGLLPIFTGCEGSEVGLWSYDNPADHLSVEVSEPEAGVRRISYLATWDGNGAIPDILSGYFDLVE